LDIDHGAWVPVDGLTEDLIAQFTAELMIDPTEHGVVYKSDTDTIETRVGDVASISVEEEQTITTPGTTDRHVFTLEALAGGQATMQSNDPDAAGAAAEGANTTDLPHKWIAWAKYGLGNFLVIPFGLHGVNFALPTAQYGNVRLLLTQGNAGAEVRISSLELVRN
jgi:hypothetical protein